MEKFFKPGSVVVIGASNSPFNLGATICQSLKDIFLFRGPVYAVNRKAEEVNRCPGYASVLDLPEVVDLAVIITPAKVVPQFVRECGQKGIRCIIIESAGFSEGGPEGQAMQSEIDGYVKEYGLRVMGPNCLGTLETYSRFCCFYGVDIKISSMLQGLFEEPGTISYIIQSGGVGVLLLESLVYDCVSVNRMVSIGNKSDIDEGDLLDFLNNDPHTEVIGMYLENVSRGAKFLETAKKVTKPILVYKTGRTAAGAKAAMSHTAGMANNDVIFNSACAQGGIIRLDSIDELHVLPKIFTAMPPLKGKNIALFTNSGAFGGIAGDLVSEAGLTMPLLASSTRERLSKTGQVFNVNNPVDIGPAPPQTYLDIFEILLSAEEVDGLLPLSSFWRDFVIDVTIELVNMCKHYNKPAAIYAPNSIERIIEVKRKHKIPLFETPELAVRALSVSYRQHCYKTKKESAR